MLVTLVSYNVAHIQPIQVLRDIKARCSNYSGQKLIAVHKLLHLTGVFKKHIFQRDAIYLVRVNWIYKYDRRYNSVQLLNLKL